MSQTKSKVHACILKEKNNKSNKKRKYAMLCYAVSVSVCLFAGSLKTPLPRLIAWSQL